MPPVWAAIVAGAGLWAIAAMLCVNLSATLYLLLIRYREFFRSFAGTALTEHFQWAVEIWSRNGGSRFRRRQPLQKLIVHVVVFY